MPARRISARLPHGSPVPHLHLPLTLLSSPQCAQAPSLTIHLGAPVDHDACHSIRGAVSRRANPSRTCRQTLLELTKFEKSHVKWSVAARPLRGHVDVSLSCRLLEHAGYQPARAAAVH